MIARSHRFHGYGSLRAVYQRGQTARAPLLSLKFSRREPGRPYRVAVVVSRKVSKSAVVRNRIRRRVYELVRQTDAELAATDLIFTVFGEQVATLEAPKLSHMVNDLLQKATQADQNAARPSVSHDIVKPEGNHEK